VTKIYNTDDRMTGAFEMIIQMDEIKYSKQSKTLI
jgi:hypothetical protein